MDDEKGIKDTIMCMFNEHTTHGRHHESQRSIVSSLIITLASALIALIGFDRNITADDLPQAIAITSLGLFGALFTLKEYERAVFHMDRARLYRNKLEKIFPELSIEDEKEYAKRQLMKKFPNVNRISLKWLWVALHLSITGIGCLIIFFAFYKA